MSADGGIVTVDPPEVPVEYHFFMSSTPHCETGGRDPSILLMAKQQRQRQTRQTTEVKLHTSKENRQEEYKRR
jgi:hypothetical protein